MSEILYETEFTLRARDVDYTGYWRPSALMLAMQEAAETHAERLGAGFDALRADNLAWVLTRSSVEMDRYPSMEQTVRLRTWPAKMRHMIFPRYFEFETVAGEPLGRASTAWALMDIGARRMAAASGQTAVQLPENNERPAPLAMPRAPRALDAAPRVLSRRAAYGDVDVNGHVNNTRYVDWLCDALPYAWFERQMLHRLCIGYDAEILPDEEISLALAQDEAGRFSLFGTAAGRACFSAAGEFVPR